MSKKQSSTGDAMRRIALLWGSQTSAGRSGLTVKGIVTAALAIADADGLASLSMRNVAEQLGVGVMSLYTYVPSKLELIDLMRDAAYSELYQRVEEAAQRPGDWRDALRFIAQRNWQLYQKHPWMLLVTTSRPLLGPHEALKYEAELRPLDGLGLSEVEMDATLTLILTHVEGCARAQAAHRHTQQDTGMSDAEWWVTHGPLLAKVVDPARFPVATRVGTASSQEYQAASNPEHVFTFGLERILDGISTLLARGNGS